MPKYIIIFEQWAQEVAEVMVEASSPEAAFAMARRLEDNDELDLEWEDGFDTHGQAIVEVRDTVGFIKLVDRMIDDLYQCELEGVPIQQNRDT